MLNFVVPTLTVLILLICVLAVTTAHASLPDTFLITNRSMFETAVFRLIGNRVPDTCPGSSGIQVNELTHTLTGRADTTYYSFARTPTADCSVSASMTGPNVSVSGSNSQCNGQNPGITLTSTAYLPNSQYCINASHSSPDGSCTTSQCLITPPERITALTYEQLQSDDVAIDANPNPGGGLRIFPDDKIPDDPIDRRKIRVKAQFNESKAGVRIYFRTFDADDPSTNAAPVDTNDTAGNAGGDNNGTVDGTAATNAGLLSIPTANPPNPNNCQPFTSGSATGLSCLTDSTGVAAVDFTTTMQPGDNFTIAASPNQSYLTGLAAAADGINLKDSNNIQVPVTTSTQNACAESSVVGCRADMVTVWRRLHFEVDSMGSVDLVNRVVGTINSVSLFHDSSCQPLPPPNPSPPNPCYPYLTRYGISVAGGGLLDEEQFQNGRIVIGLRTFNVFGNYQENLANTVLVKSTSGLARKGVVGKSFILYDDDDYDLDNALVNGDANEQLERLAETTKYMSDLDGVQEDGKPSNVFGLAYIRPEYNWANNRNYNQTNVPFSLNIDDIEVDNKLSTHRDSKLDERNDFWIVYLLIGYQGSKTQDVDGENVANNGIGTLAAAADLCDCLVSQTCIGTSCTAIPRGVDGSLVYEEVMQDETKRLRKTLSTEIYLKGNTAPHEIGHQFGLKGDNKPPTPTSDERPFAEYNIMDYPLRPSQGDDYSFHPAHLNIMRRRIKSPGEN